MLALAGWMAAEAADYNIVEYGAKSDTTVLSTLAVQQAIAELVRGKTVVVVAHRLNSIREVDNIVVVDDGRVVAQGTHEELLRDCGLYAHLWEEQERASVWQIV